MAIFSRGPLNGGVECRWVGRIRDSDLASPRVVNAATVSCYQHGAAGRWQFVTLIAGSKRRSLLIAGDDGEMFMTRSLNVTPKTTEQHLIARNDKSVAYVTNNKRLCSTFVLLKLTTDRHEALRGLFATAELLVVMTACMRVYVPTKAKPEERSWATCIGGTENA